MAHASGSRQWDVVVVVVGAGPNGLTAAIVLAYAGLSTLVVEAKSSVGGGMRTEALTMPGVFSDVCSTVHPLGIASPVFRALGLERHGVTWIHPPAPLAHVLADARPSRSSAPSWRLPCSSASTPRRMSIC